MRLSRATLDRVPAALRPGRRAITTGIVHFGPGAFHRAHQADYIDRLLDHDPRWGIAAVSMRSRDTVDTLAAQDGYYTLAIRDAAPSFRIIAAHSKFLGPGKADETHALLGDPAVRLITVTVTEKGYCLAADGTLDHGHPDVVHDLARTDRPRSVIGWIVAGLAARRAARTAPFTVLPCDNLADNGRKLHAALTAFARVRDPALAEWIASEVVVPGTMVDAITPASDEALYATVTEAIGVSDRAAVQREAFAQWVIEDRGALGPDLAGVGAIVTRDLRAYEQAKLRILNGAHSTLAYAGLLRGAASVADAMADAPLAGFVDAMIHGEIVPTLAPTAGFDLNAYHAAVLTRFRNPVIVHRLEQIAHDGSHKLPYRLGDTLAAHRAVGRMPPRIVAAIGCWVAFVMQRARNGIAIVDPAGALLAELASDGDAATVTARLLHEGIGLDPRWQSDPALVTAVNAAAQAAVDGDWAAVFAVGVS